MSQQSANNLLIEVTQEDIDAAIRNNSSHCAVASAIQRQVASQRVAVDIQTIRMTMKGTSQRRIYLTPAKVQQYIIDFDAGDPLKPFSFWMKKPAYVQHTRSERLEMGNRAELVPVERMAHGTASDVNIHMATPEAENDSPAYVALPAPRRAPPRVSRQASRRSFGLREMRINQGYQRSDTKQYGKHRRQKGPDPDEQV